MRRLLSTTARLIVLFSALIAAAHFIIPPPNSQCWLAVTTEDAEHTTLVSPPIAWTFHIVLPKSAPSAQPTDPRITYIDPVTHQQRSHVLKGVPVYSSSYPSDPYTGLYAVSPDGKYIAYIRSGDANQGQAELLAIDRVDGSQVGTIKAASSYTFIEWSADSQYIELRDNGQSRLISIKDMSLSEVPSSFPSYPMAWSHHGHRYAYLDYLDEGAFVIIGSPEGAPQKITNLGNDFSVPSEQIDLQWSANDQFVSIVYPNSQDQADDADIYSLDGKQVGHYEEYNLYHAAEYGGEAARVEWVGNTFLMVGQDKLADTQANHDVSLMAFIPGKGRQTLSRPVPSSIFSDSYYYVHDPIRDRIAVENRQTDNLVNLVLMDADGSHQNTLIENVNVIEGTSWSPDGQYVATVGSMTAPSAGTNSVMMNDDFYGAQNQPLRAVSAQLVWADGDGSHPQKLNYYRARIVEWLPDRQALLYLAQPTQDINDVKFMLLDLKTGVPHILADGIPDEGYRNTHYASWGRWTLHPSPDGEHLLISYVVDWQGVEGGGGDPSAGAYLSTWNGDQRMALGQALTVDHFTWSPDGLTLIAEVNTDTLSAVGDTGSAMDVYNIAHYENGNYRQVHLDFGSNEQWISCDAKR